MGYRKLQPLFGKNESEVEPYSIILYRQQNKFGLNKSEYRIVDYLFDQSKKTGYCFAKTRTIAEHLNLSLSDTYEIIANLQKEKQAKGLIRPQMIKKTRDGFSVLVEWQKAKDNDDNEPRTKVYPSQRKARKHDRLKLSYRELELYRTLCNVIDASHYFTEYYVEEKGQKKLIHEQVTLIKRKDLAEMINLPRESKYIIELIKRLESKHLIQRYRGDIQHDFNDEFYWDQSYIRLVVPTNPVQKEENDFAYPN